MSIEEKVAAWGEPWLELWIERAGIMQHDGEVRPDLAEQRAYLIVGKMRRDAGHGTAVQAIFLEGG
jgi:hypothetical protein